MRNKLFLAGVAVFVVMATAAASASTVSGINVGTGDLDSVVSQMGIHTTFNFGNLLGALMKFGGAYTIAHSAFEVHDVWKQQGYRLKDFTHVVVGAGGTGITVGGIVALIGNFLGSGQGSLIH